MAFAWLQLPDMRSISWWLPQGSLNAVVWWAVFTLNLLVLVWVLWKLLFAGKTFSVPKMLRSRGEAIVTGMQEAEQALRQAEGRLAEIEARIGNLPDEMAALEREAVAEAAHEYQRVVEEGRQEAERIVQLGKQEMEAASRLAQKELRGLAAALAVDLASRHIQQHLTPEQDEAVVRSALAGMRTQRPN